MKTKQMKKLEWYVKASKQDIWNLVENQGGQIFGYKEKFGFIDNNSKVLAVAHIDTVQPFKSIKRKTKKNRWSGETENRVHAQGLDDRLGIYIIFELMKKINMSVLITDNEESANSTAKNFNVVHDFNWIVEFDRGGDDVVLYDYDTNEDFVAAVEKYFCIGYGTYSDISDLEFMGRCAFNVGIGYYHAHSKDSYFVPKEAVDNIKQFLEFYKEFYNTKFEYEKRIKKITGYGGWREDNFYLNYGRARDLDVCDWCWSSTDCDDLTETPSGKQICFACENQGVIECWYCGKLMYDNKGSYLYGTAESFVCDNCIKAGHVKI